MAWPELLRMMYSLRSSASVTVTRRPRPMNTCRITGSSWIAGWARSELSQGTSRQPSSAWPSSLIARSISYSQAMREAGSRGRNTMPTPYCPAGGSFTPCLAISSRRKRSGIWISSPAPSESFGSQPTAPRCVRLRSTVSPCSTIVCDFLPLMCATKPTPHASCSREGSYSPWAGKVVTGFLNIPLLRCSDNGLADQPLIHVTAQHRAAERVEQHEARLSLRCLLVDRHQLDQPLRRERRALHRQTHAAHEVAQTRHFSFFQLTH